MLCIACPQLTEVILPEGIETLEGYVFCDSKLLKSVTLPSTIKDVGERCFPDTTKIIRTTAPKPTETPKPTTTPKPTETPEPTATPKPTQEPVKKPKNTTSLKTKSSKKKTLVVSWKPVKSVSGYQVQYSLYKNMKKA